jgi:hypothetical protein
MAQHMNSRQQHQNQSGMSQSGNQGMLNHPPQGGSVGGQNQVDRTQRSQGSFTGNSVQSQGYMDSQGGQSIGQRGDCQQGAGQRNEPIEQPRTGSGIDRR